jgi:glutathione S-transferase
MSPLILHHYDGSPFSEKVRLMLGYKGLAWASVKIPAIMPKPDVTALTGGYRKTPILQVGADIYCDSALIARLLEAMQPTPTLYPASAPLAPLLAQWADSTLFWAVIPYTMQPAGLAHVFAGVPPEAVKAFAADRAPFAAGLRRQTAVDATANLRTHLATLNAQLADGRPFLFGAEPAIADFSVAHCIWYVRRAPPMAGVLEPFADVQRWFEQVAAFGHGEFTPLQSGDAVALAASAPSHAPAAVGTGLGFEAGQAVTVNAIDYGCDPVSGTLVGLSETEVVLRRSDERAGTVHVHFPRAGFQIKQEQRT